MIGRIREKVQTLGPADAGWFIVDRILQRATGGNAALVKYYFVAQPVAHAAPRPARPGGRTRIYVTASADEIVTQAARPAATIRSRFDQRAVCVAAEREGRLAGFIWLCPDAYVEDAVRCTYRWAPAASAMWDFDVFVAPEWRLGRLFSQLWESAHALLRSRKVAWTLSRIDAFNAGSLAAHRKLGAEKIARAWFVRIGRWQIALSSAAPHWHLSTGEDDVPHYCFDLSALQAAGSTDSGDGSGSQANNR